MMLKETAFRRRDELATALHRVAQKYGKESLIYKALGGIAWGRYDGEPCATDSKDNAVFGLGVLEGTRSTAIHAARAGLFGADSSAIGRDLERAYWKLR